MNDLPGLLSVLAFIGGLVIGLAIVVVLIRIATHRMAKGIQLNLTYQEFADKQMEWHRKKGSSLLFHDQVLDRFCPRCGKANMVSLVMTGSYDGRTGHRKVRAYLDCPGFGIWPLTLHTKKERCSLLNQEFAYELISGAIEDAVVEQVI